jgi:hypothetical protein
MKWLVRMFGRLRGRKPIFGRDWGYDDERQDKVIGYEERGGMIRISDQKTWRETLP